MSVCEFHPITDPIEIDSISECSQKHRHLVLQDELTWGQSYRHYKKKEKQIPIPPKKSPIDIPFKLCRELQRQELKRKRPSSKTSGKSKTKSKPEKQPTLLEKSVMSQNQYMDYLSTPRKVEEPPPPPKKKRPCELEPCPPRFVQLAVPNKRRVYENWKAYHEMLPTDVIVRYEQMLHTDKNLEPKEARYYYKRLDKKKRKELKKKRVLRKKKQAEKEKGDKAWLKEQINLTTDVIMDYVKEEPLFTLNFKQLMLSDAILDLLDKSHLMKKPSRKTKNHYKKTIVEVSDKLAVWMDTLTRFVDVQAIDSDEDLPPLTISSLEEEGEESEEEEEEEGESLAESEPEVLFKEESQRRFWEEGEEGVWGADLGVGGGKTEEEFISDLFKKGKGAEEDELDANLLARLIAILENSADELLKSFVNDKMMPDVTYADVLDRLKALQSGKLKAEVTKRPLEEVLEDWAKKNDPDKVDDRLLKEIHKAAELLGEWWNIVIEEPFAKQKVPPVEALHTKKDKGAFRFETEFGEEGGSEEWREEEEEEEERYEREGEEKGTFESGEGEEKASSEEGPEDEKASSEEGPEEEKVSSEEGPEDERAFSEEGPEEEEEGERGAEEEGERGAEEEGEEEGAKTATGEAEGAEEVQGGDKETQLNMDDLGSRAEKEQAQAGLEAEAATVEMEFPSTEKLIEKEAEEFEKEGEAEAEPRKELSVIYEKGMEFTAEEAGKVIKGHKPSVVFEHSPNMVCCLSLKTWAVWLLEITHNAHNWTKWVHGVIQKVREFTATIRGDVVGPDGKKKVLYKKDWRNFAKEVDEMIVAWRQYGAHVRELSTSIVENFHGKEVKCCPKCLQDHLIKNVVCAHETLQALTEAMNCATYWQRTLDEIVKKTGTLTELGEPEKEVGSDESSEGEGGIDAVIEELPAKGEDEDDGESVYEIEELTSTSQTEEGGKRPSAPAPPGPHRKS